MEVQEGLKVKKSGHCLAHAWMHGCRDRCPAPFSYFVRQKGYFLPFPLFVGTLSPPPSFNISPDLLPVAILCYRYCHFVHYTFDTK